MGNDPATSVTTPRGHLHEVDNLYVTDGASLPTSGGVPNTMTILANALRIAEGVVARRRA
jgi:choline dehydrogenase-like flavoprotein